MNGSPITNEVPSASFPGAFQKGLLYRFTIETYTLQTGASYLIERGKSILIRDPLPAPVRLSTQTAKMFRADTYKKSGTRAGFFNTRNRCYLMTFKFGLPFFGGTGALSESASLTSPEGRVDCSVSSSMVFSVSVAVRSSSTANTVPAPFSRA